MGACVESKDSRSDLGYFEFLFPDLPVNGTSQIIARFMDGKMEVEFTATIMQRPESCGARDIYTSASS